MSLRISDMIRPKLILVTGFPSSGKSRIGRYLEYKHDLTYVSPDETRKALGYEYDPDWESLPSTERAAFEEKELKTAELVFSKKIAALWLGRGVVIDMAGGKNAHRYFALTTKSYADPDRSELVEAERYMVYVRVSPGELEKRNRMRGRDGVGTWFERHWEDPVESSGYQLITVENEQEWDFPASIRTIEKELGF